MRPVVPGPERAAAVLGSRYRALGRGFGRRPWLRDLLLAMLLSALIIPLHGRAGIRIAEARMFDILSTFAPPRPAAPGAVIVAIDEPSFAEIPEQWPWSRATHARLIESLRAAGARAIGFDVVFAEPSNPDADAKLAAALGPDSVLAADREVVAMDQGTQVTRVGPFAALMEGGATSGVTSVNLDGDGVLRRMPPLDDSFARALMQVEGRSVPDLPGRPLVQYFGGARSYPTVSYYQALDPAGFLPPGFFQGKTVLIGLSLKAAPVVDSGAVDAFATPFTIQTGTLTAGVEVHATILDNLRHGLAISPAPVRAISFAVIACALLGCGAGASAMSWRTGLIALGSLVGIVAASWLMLRFGRIWLPPVTPALAALTGLGARVGLDYARERRLRAAVSAAFSRYVTPDLVAELARNPDSLKLGGERRELSVLFCDVRGFTSLSEQMKDDPVGLTDLINRLLDALSEQVMEARGTIDKYMGDCIMAFWNAPLPEPKHARAAVRAALRMSDAVRRLNAELQLENPDLPSLAVGVGVNTGMCLVGNVGSRWRYDYSVLGDTVNLASRLEGLTKDYGVAVILGAATAAVVGDEFTVLELDRIAVRGRSEAAPIFTVFANIDEASRSALSEARRRLEAAQVVEDLPACLEALRLMREAWPPLSAYSEKMAAILTARFAR
ncbi:adenylate/guanylate cyclase domain-containing protein [Agaricicola taiwanensis]|uniref:Adenylate/guanylate cyclase domain-containing protein n=1 Tax=Agaricicola taiwanensis TaxID=591372 RepID=A0A8J2VVE9_9RHOB|nr:adenylate/guanylate cyclase domain-containing protein [Agaricicola taiwanensis]GGE41457.1 adenylate/guanylate cyclase domain-containing protein [Agaricicola taiwanensis]